ncbi:MAG: ABC transporter ATP-binding protein [Candidatus Bathyarchaeia archaeon]|jgi:putative ABC transport system ATP-binding protein
MSDGTRKVVVNAVDLCKTYRVGDAKVEILKHLNLSVTNGQFVAINGHSGAGKTTLLNILSGIDRPTSGTIRVFDADLTQQTEDFLADFRCSQIGIVFQTYNLVSTLTVAENIAFPLEWRRTNPTKIEQRVQELLEKIGLQQRRNHFPSQLSGGEQQRVAFARALANNPPLLLVDEPTGNLDERNRQNIIQILKELRADGKTIIVATHDKEITSIADQKLVLDNGELAAQHD